MSALMLLASYGLCFTLINKLKFLRKVSFLNKMLECVFCTGWHTGWITHLCTMPETVSFSQLFIMAFASASFCYTVDTVIIYLEYKTAGMKSNSQSNLFG